MCHTLCQDLQIYKFKSNLQCFVLQNVLQPPCETVANTTLSVMYVWNHESKHEGSVKIDSTTGK
jgi:hypothetical protein